jgi:spoIIIJ-associated protein
MKVAEKTARTLEEAIEACLVELGVSKDQVSVEVLEEPGKKGLFGLFGNKMAKVRVSYEDDAGNLACQFLKKTNFRNGS